MLFIQVWFENSKIR